MERPTETYALAAAGALAGLYKYYRPSPAALAWGSIVVYELICPDGQLLSEGCDRAIDKYPLLTKVAIGVTALHLANALPDRFDPFKIGIDAIKKSNR